MNKAKEFLDKIGVDNEDVIVLLEEMLESFFMKGYREGFKRGIVCDLEDTEDTSDLEFENWLNNKK